VTSVTIVVPVLNRPDHAALFVASARFATLGMPVGIVAVTENRTDFDAWRATGERLLYAKDRHTFAEKCNHAAGWISSDWLFFTGDDVRFQCGWLEEALRVADETGAMVVGTNDLGNPHVMAGDRGTHCLVNRRYIMERGASGDGPGTAFSEAYKHCCDVELVEVAKARGVWAHAHDSIVEHCHPTWGKGEMDATYAEGMSHQVADWRTWKKREQRVLAWAKDT